jgi:hypothetical protein
LFLGVVGNLCGVSKLSEQRVDADDDGVECCMILVLEVRHYFSVINRKFGQVDLYKLLRDQICLL